MTTDVTLIDRHSPTPYYQQLVDVLSSRISSGTIASGERLPSENDLCKEFGLSRATVRQALQLLETRGVVQRVVGRGVYASDPREDRGWMIQGQEGFLENAVGYQNRLVTTVVQRSGHVVLPAAAARSLEVPDGSEGFELVRLRSLDGVPALFSINYLPAAVEPVVAAAQDVLSGTASLSELLESAGYALGGAHRVIHSLTAPAEIASALGIGDSTPVLRVRSTSWNREGLRYDFYETWVRTDVVPLEVNVSTVSLGR